MTGRQTRTWLTALALAAAGCRVGPAYHAPTPPAAVAASYKESPVHFQDTGGWTVANPQAAMLKGKWWQVFGDPELNALEDRLEINNQTIQQYFENFMEARTLIAEARASYWPTITLNPSAVVSHGSGNSSYGNLGAAGATSVNAGTATAQPSGTHTLFSVPLDLSWEPDLWGKIRNEVRAAAYGAQVSAADLENERLTEEAALAEYFFELRGQDELTRVLEATVAADRDAYALAQSRYRTGVDTEISVVEAGTTLESAEAQATGLATERAQYEHAIAVLVGAVATDFAMPVRPVVYTPPAIPIGVPSQLVERRPDVAAAERTLAEANAEIGIGYGAFFPQLSISAEAGVESSAFKDLFSLPSRIWSVGPSVSQTVFDGGLYRAELHQYEATYNADLASYRQTVLTAFEQVEDALAGVRIDSAEIAEQQQAVASAQRFLTLEMARYRTGIDPYVDVLTAQTTLLSAQEQLVTLEVDRMTACVELVQALGGGWDRSQLPAPGASLPAPGSGGGGGQ